MRNKLFLGGFLVFVGVVLVVVGFKEQDLAAAASKEPEVVSLQKLIARGPEGNPNIILTDFALCDGYVYKARSGTWQSAWVPAVPQTGAVPVRAGRPVVVQALIFTTNARDEADLYQRCGQPRLRVLVTNKITSLGRKERELLQQTYPGTDFARCLILQEGREPAGLVKLLFLLGGGSLVAVAGLGWFGFGIYRWRRDRAHAGREQMGSWQHDEEERPHQRRPVRGADDEP